MTAMDINNYFLIKLIYLLFMMKLVHDNLQSDVFVFTLCRAHFDRGGEFCERYVEIEFKVVVFKI